jgi:hypothetical protein
MTASVSAVGCMPLLAGAGRRQAAFSYKDQRERSRLPGFDVPPIHGGATFYKRIEDFREARIEGLRRRNLNVQHLAFREVKARHAIAFVQVGEAIYPCVHVHAIEIREAERLTAHFVEGLPVGDYLCIKMSRSHESSTLHYAAS